jgi:hypothetical protein
MIENYRTGAVWGRFMRNPEIILGLQRAGFVGAPLAVPGAAASPSEIELLPAAPNPFRGTTTLAYRLSATTPVRLSVYDMAGRRVADLIDGVQEPGFHRVPFSPLGSPSGIYLARLESQGRAVARPIVLIR